MLRIRLGFELTNPYAAANGDSTGQTNFFQIKYYKSERSFYALFFFGPLFFFNKRSAYPIILDPSVWPVQI